MSTRVRPVHRSAIPLLNAMQAGRFTRASASLKLGVSVQVLGNWLARGVPARRAPDVAALLGMPTDRYLLVSGFVSENLSAAPLQGITASYAALPPILQQYICDKVEKLAQAYSQIPADMIGKLSPPVDSAKYIRWQSEIEGILLHLASIGAERARRKKRRTGSTIT